MQNNRTLTEVIMAIERTFSIIKPNAVAGTLRADYADSFTENGTHGSDSVESAAREIAFFFAEGEVCPRTR